MDGLLPVDVGALGAGGCISCGTRPDGAPVCCSDLNAGCRKSTIDAGDVKFGQIWVEPAGGKRMLWFEWGGETDLTVVREITYDPTSQELRMLPVAEIKTLRDPDPLGVLHTGKASIPAGGALPLFVGNVSSFDVEAMVVLPASGPAAFGAAIMAARPPVPGEPAPGGASAVLTVNVTAPAAADRSRVVSMELTGIRPPSMELIKVRVPPGGRRVGTQDKPGAYRYNFTLPANAGAGDEMIPVRILADATLVEVFIADGRGVITIATEEPTNDGHGLYFLAGGAGLIVVSNATAWAMCM